MGESEQALRQRMAASLRSLQLNLQVAHAGVVVTAAALQNQNADHDAEVACVLKHLVGRRLAEQMEHTAALLASL